MTTDDDPPILLMRPGARLDYASFSGYLISKPTETNLRDRWSRQCVNEGRIIAHLIPSARTGHASIRLNGAAQRGRVLTDAGWSLAGYLATEHGGFIHWRHDPAVVDIHSIASVVASPVMKRLLDSELWVISCEVQ
jgi:hypothetical protein